MPAFREALGSIAADETCHAELAWRFVHRALHDADATRRGRAAAPFEQALASLPELQLPAGVDPHAWQAHGRLSPRQQHHLVVATAREVIAPCAEALLGQPLAIAGRLDVATVTVSRSDLTARP